jgi:hypothetical protein
MLLMRQLIITAAGIAILSLPRPASAGGFLYTMQTTEKSK